MTNMIQKKQLRAYSCMEMITDNTLYTSFRLLQGNTMLQRLTYWPFSRLRSCLEIIVNSIKF